MAERRAHYTYCKSKTERKIGRVDDLINIPNALGNTA
jgi:hypothetical protein